VVIGCRGGVAIGCCNTHRAIWVWPRPSGLHWFTGHKMRQP